MRSRTIPAESNGLLEYQDLCLVVISGKILQILFVFRKIDGELAILNAYAVLILEGLHNHRLAVLIGLSVPVRQLNEKQRIYNNTSRFIRPYKLLALLQRFPQDNIISATCKLTLYGFGAATAHHAFEVLIEYHCFFYHLLGFYIIYINVHHLVGILHYRSCGNFNCEIM